MPVVEDNDMINTCSSGSSRSAVRCVHSAMARVARPVGLESPSREVAV